MLPICLPDSMVIQHAPRANFDFFSSGYNFSLSLSPLGKKATSDDATCFLLRKCVINFDDWVQSTTQLEATTLADLSQSV
jgi:hypothetical protein